MKTAIIALVATLTTLAWQKAEETLPPPKGIEAVAAITLLVKDQDEALAWYTQKLGFEKRRDDTQSIDGFRWLTVGPRGQPELEFALLPIQHGDPAQLGKMPTIVLRTSSCARTFEELKARGVTFQGRVEAMAFGKTANFVDLYGNPYQLLEPAKGAAPTSNDR
jgi:catechol 2,3-dioxygenase-like lactoylglutathione lyase family enzyme